MNDKTQTASRVTRSKADARISYDRISRWYDLIAGAGEKKFIDAGLQKLGIGEGEKVLEIGFGTGDAAIALARLVGGTGKVYGIDISEGMLKRAAAKARRAGLSGTIDLRTGDGTMLPFTHGMLDAVFMGFTLELFDTPELPIVLCECRRVLRDNGRLCVVGMSKKTEAASVKFYEWLHKMFPLIVDCRPIPIAEILAENGFRVEDASVMSLWTLPVEIVAARK